jgi:hypothetical protein
MLRHALPVLKQPRASALILILIGFALRAWELGAQSLWYDEAFSVLFAQQHHALDLFIREAQWNLNTPLYYIALKLWMAGAGESEFSVRFVSALAGTVSVALAHRLASMLTPQPGLIAQLLVAISPVGIFVSQEARMYALAGMLCLVSTLMLLTAMRSQKASHWLAWWGTAMLAFLGHVLCAILGVAQLVVGIAASAWRSRSQGAVIPRAQIAAAFALGAALLTYVGIVIWPYRAVYGVSYSAPADLAALTVHTLASQFLPRLLPADWIAPAALSMLLAIALTAAVSLWMKPRCSFLLLTASVVSLALVGLVIFCAVIGKFASRYPTLLAPTAMAVIGAAIANIRPFRRIRPSVVVIVGVGLGLAARLWLGQPIYANEDFRGAIAHIRARLAPDERVILVSGHFAPAFEYYWRGAREAWIALPPDPVLNVNHTLTYTDTVPTLNEKLAGKGGAWLLAWQDDVIDPTGIVPALLRRQAQAFGPLPDTPTFAGLGLLHYRFFQPYRPLPESLPTGGFSVENNRPDAGLRSLGCRQPVSVYAGDPFLEIHCFWQTKPYVPLSPLTKVSLRLFSSSGELIVQSDQPITYKGFPYTPYEKPLFGSHILLLPADVRAGEYMLRVIPYNEESGEIAPQVSLPVRLGERARSASVKARPSSAGFPSLRGSTRHGAPSNDSQSGRARSNTRSRRRRVAQPGCRPWPRSALRG